jgi:hypothetical protein
MTAVEEACGVAPCFPLPPCGGARAPIGRAEGGERHQLVFAFDPPSYPSLSRVEGRVCGEALSGNSPMSNAA